MIREAVGTEYFQVSEVDTVREHLETVCDVEPVIRDRILAVEGERAKLGPRQDEVHQTHRQGVDHHLLKVRSCRKVKVAVMGMEWS